MFGHSARALFWIKNTLADCARGPQVQTLDDRNSSEKIFHMNFSHRIR
jgi:hypothetical protein